MCYSLQGSLMSQFFIYAILYQTFFHWLRPRKMRGLARGRQRGVTFGESEGELHGVSCGDFDLRVFLT